MSEKKIVIVGAGYLGFEAGPALNAFSDRARLS